MHMPQPLRHMHAPDAVEYAPAWHRLQVALLSAPVPHHTLSAQRPGHQHTNNRASAQRPMSMMHISRNPIHSNKYEANQTSAFQPSRYHTMPQGLKVSRRPVI
jgi:hypothetical protein